MVIARYVAVAACAPLRDPTRAEMAIADINARGGVMGRKLKLEIGDDACDPKQAVAVANQLATRKVAGLVAAWAGEGRAVSGAASPGAERVIVTPGRARPSGSVT